MFRLAADAGLQAEVLRVVPLLEYAIIAAAAAAAVVWAIVN
jgi:hypothetical protein